MYWDGTGGQSQRGNGGVVEHKEGALCWYGPKTKRTTTGELPGNKAGRWGDERVREVCKGMSGWAGGRSSSTAGGGRSPRAAGGPPPPSPPASGSGWGPRRPGIPKLPHRNISPPTIPHTNLKFSLRYLIDPQSYLPSTKPGDCDTHPLSLLHKGGKGGGRLGGGWARGRCTSAQTAPEGHCVSSWYDDQ